MKKILLNAVLLASVALADTAQNIKNFQDFNQNEKGYAESLATTKILNTTKLNLKINVTNNLNQYCTNSKDKTVLAVGELPLIALSREVLKNYKGIDSFAKKDIIDREVYLEQCSKGISQMIGSFSKSLDSTGGYKFNADPATYCSSFLQNSEEIGNNLYNINLFLSSLQNGNKDINFAAYASNSQKFGYQIYADPIFFIKFAIDNQLFKYSEFNEFFDLVANNGDFTSFLEDYNENIEKPTDICFVNQFNNELGEATKYVKDIKYYYDKGDNACNKIEVLIERLNDKDIYELFKDSTKFTVNRYLNNKETGIVNELNLYVDSQKRPLQIMHIYKEMFNREYFQVGNYFFDKNACEIVKEKLNKINQQ